MADYWLVGCQSYPAMSALLDAELEYVGIALRESICKAIWRICAIA